MNVFIEVAFDLYIFDFIKTLRNLFDQNFIKKSLGVLGSLMFNVLGVTAFAGIAVTDYIQLDWWPLTR